MRAQCVTIHVMTDCDPGEPLKYADIVGPMCVQTRHYGRYMSSWWSVNTHTTTQDDSEEAKVPPRQTAQEESSRKRGGKVKVRGGERRQALAAAAHAI